MKVVLTDSNGRVVRFYKLSLLVMTSNVGARKFRFLDQDPLDSLVDLLLQRKAKRWILLLKKN